MFSYCNNNPIMLIDENGEFPWLAVGIVVVCMIGGGIWGLTRDSKLGPQEPDLKLPTTANPPRGQDNLGKEQIQDNTSGLDVNAEDLTPNDRLKNTVIGMGLGMAVGGAITSVVGAVGTVAVGSASTYIAAFSGTGAQTFSIGALAYDIFAMVVAPFFGVEMETIEIEP